MILCKLNTSLHECSSAQLPFANLFSKCVGADKHFHECINALVPFGKMVCSCVGAVTGKTLQKTILNTSNTSQTKQRLHSTSEYKNPGNFDSPPPISLSENINYKKYSSNKNPSKYHLAHNHKPSKKSMSHDPASTLRKHRGEENNRFINKFLLD